MIHATNTPTVADRAAFEAEMERLRTREKAHTREGDAIAAARRRLPMVEVDANLALIGPDGPVTLLDAFGQGPHDEGIRYHNFMGWDMPWYSALPSLETLLVGRIVGMMHLVCYLRDGDRVFETYWTTRRGVEEMDYSYALMDLTVFGRQESWEDSPAGWPQQWQVDGSNTRMNGRPIAQWSRIEHGRSDELT